MDMLNFEYEIEEDDNGKLFISLSEDFKYKPEHRFMVYEMCIDSIYDLLERNKKLKTLKEETKEKIIEMLHVLTQIRDKYGELLKGMRDFSIELDNIINNDEEETD